ncbi:FKBP-type peptidyl-prolyl cis-trans isomerase [Jonesia quinghaiensis]|uniref:FKBP-type peptidyl-prolyl cis-trans isomerase n=1 Tax=Jonesia quinghaiensis TaxID=262806 RepID=UPI00048C781F|nr:FKBP-type peptidyl-prolyl cis-trans isomerase [Jonesia quinghaiensis]
MKIRPMRSLVAVAMASALVLAGCSSDESTDDPTDTPTAGQETPAEADTTSAADAAALEGVTVEVKDEEAPTVSFDGELSFEGNAALAVTPGDGDAIAEGDLVAVNMSVFDGSTGEGIQSTYDEGNPTHLLMDGTQIPQAFVNAMVEIGVGGTAILAQPGTPAQEASDEMPEIPATPAYVYVVETEANVPTTAQGSDVEQSDDSLPTVTLDDTGKPSVEIPDGFEGTDDMQVITLKEGDGAAVAETDFVWAQYTGWQLDGTEFDSSWSRGMPMGFSLTQVIPGWTEGLTGVKAGSQVMLIIPGDKGYGEGEGQSESGQPLGDLIFVVDVLGVN